jgi:DNA-binding NarL/FixJ family response regulator
LTTPDLNPSRLATGGVGSGERRLRVLIVDDHEVVHWGFRLMLGEQPWVERCVSARNAEEAMTLTRRYEPHVALVDLFVGQESGAEICERLRSISPKTNVLMISGAGRISPNAARAAGEVLEAIAGGATNREIAATLFLSPHTIKEHTSALYRKLGVRNRAEAVQKAQRLGLIS